MKILIVQDYLRSGGTERQAVFLGAAAAKAGHEVTLLTFRPRGALGDEAENQPFAFKSLQPFDFHLDWFAPGLRRAATEAAPDLVLCMGWMANCYAGFIQARLPHSAVVCTMQTGRALPWLYRRSLRRCRHVIANSLVAKRVLTDDHDLPGHKISVIHNPVLRSHGTDAPRNQTLRTQHGANPSTVVFLNVAMFRPAKNQRELIKICSRLPGYLDWQLWFAGDGVARKNCERLALDLGLSGRVRFLGYQSDPTPIYQAADVAVLTSQSESLSNFLIEAQLHGLPAVAYNVGGVGECFQPNESGFLHENLAQTAFVESLDRLIRDPSLRRRFGIAARAHSRNAFSADQQIRAHLSLFAELVKV